ncbi:DUF3046 domain-containing protein [Lolliginicoccus levis]|uniref:DUF3046 domain-containing protein n=1 Tax=Lolliginicoccus levis TaxID=2919542 RepID=UPI00241D9F29|nr:DUF3046 domain-containing protein [Lolliginicoccus levis]
MRLTDFHDKVESCLGARLGPTLLRDHVLTSLGGVTAERAISSGVSLREVWRALCDEFDVPELQR